MEGRQGGCADLGVGLESPEGVLLGEDVVRGWNGLETRRAGLAGGKKDGEGLLCQWRRGWSMERLRMSLVSG